jgi:hypothetical protein
MQPNTSDSTSTTSLQDLPLPLQHLIFASAAAPLTTCKASAAIAQDASLIATWLLAKNQYPLQTAVDHQLWDACIHLCSTCQYIPDARELNCCLFTCAREGATAVVATLLQWCCQEHHEGCGACAALHAALKTSASHGHVATCKLLLHHPCNSAQDVRWAVVEAALVEQLDVLQLLITSRPDAASPHLRGCPAIEAAYYGNAQAMQLLLQHGADINGKPGTPWSDNRVSTDTPLAHAVYNNSVSFIKWMLEQGAHAGPALAAAVRAGNLPVFRLLLDWEPDISTWGGLAFRSALKECRMGIACLLLGAGPPGYFMSATPPHPGIEMDDIDYCLNRFLEMAYDDQAPAFLQAAVQHGHTEFAQMLQQRRVALPTQLHVHS